MRRSQSLPALALLGFGVSCRGVLGGNIWVSEAYQMRMFFFYDITTKIAPQDSL